MKNISSIICIIIAIALFFLYIKPEWQVISDLRVQKTTYDAALAQAAGAQTLRDNLVSQYNNISDSDKQKLVAIIPDTFDAASIASNISNRAVVNGLTFKGIIVAADDASSQSAQARTITAIVPQTDANPYQTHVLNITVVGQYSNFISFLKNIESDVQLLDVDKIDIGINPQLGGGLEFKVEAKTYSLK